MKTLAVGIVLIMLVSTVFFATSIVKNPDMFNIIKKTNIGAMSDPEKTFIDVQEGFVFMYHENLKMKSPETLPGYAPIFGTFNDEIFDVEKINSEFSNVYSSDLTSDGDYRGYIAISKNKINSFSTTDEEIETYSSKNPMQPAIEKLVGNVVDLRIENVQKITYPNAIAGFILDYSVISNKKIIAKGKMYFYRIEQKLKYGFSIVIPKESREIDTAEVQSGGKKTNEKIKAMNLEMESAKNNTKNKNIVNKITSTVFLQNADITFKSMSIK